MAIYSETLTAVGDATTGRQFSGLIVVGIHGLDNGALSLQVSPDDLIWYDVRVYTDDGEFTYAAPGEGGQDYYRVKILSKPRTGDVVIRLGNNDGSGVGGQVVQLAGSLPVSSGYTVIGDGSKTLASSGAEQLSAGSVLCKRVDIVANSGNLNFINVGGSGVTSSTGRPIVALQGYTVEIDNLNKIYIIGTVGEGVTYTYFN